MATSFFYIYVMATSFFYIYIDIDIEITFTNLWSVQSFYWTQFFVMEIYSMIIIIVFHATLTLVELKNELIQS